MTYRILLLAKRDIKNPSKGGGECMSFVWVIMKVLIITPESSARWCFIMKILMITPEYPPRGGGIACHVKNLSKALTDLGHEVIVISPSHSNSKSYTSSGVLVLRIKSRYLPSFPFPTLSSISFSPVLLRTLSRMIRAKLPQIIHVHGHHYPLNWFALEYAKKILFRQY